MILESLQKVLPPPKNPYRTGDEMGWKNLEIVLNVSLPSEYKDFISKYGTGGIDNFLWFLTPFVEDRNVNFLKKTKIIVDAYKESRHDFPKFFKHHVFPENNGLLPWAYTDNGDVIFWQIKNNHDNWPIVVYDSRSQNFLEYYLSTIEFLIKLITKELVCAIFPDDFPSDKSEFIPINVD